MAKLNEEEFLEKEFDFSKAIRNPYTEKLKKPIMITVSEMTIDYFKNESSETGIPYQTLMNLYLDDCAIKKKKISIEWK